jgi:hypothetical protein
MGSISFAMVLVAGRKRVPSPATGSTAFLSGFSDTGRFPWIGLLLAYAAKAGHE